MTDFHCAHCHRRLRLATHAYRVMCCSCDEPMRRGQGRDTRLDPHLLVRIKRSPSDSYAPIMPSEP